MASSTVWPGGSSMTTVLGASGEMAVTSVASTETSGLATLDLGGPGFIAHDDDALAWPFASPLPGLSGWAATVVMGIATASTVTTARSRAAHAATVKDRSRTGKSLPAICEFRFHGMPIEE